jgi:hypothetical protein
MRLMRGGLDSHPCWLLKTKTLTDLSFLTIRQIRMKIEVETRIEHADCEQNVDVHGAVFGGR